MPKVIIYPGYSIRTQSLANKLPDWHDGRRFKGSRWQGLMNEICAKPKDDLDKEVDHFRAVTNPKLMPTLVPSKVYSYDISGLQSVSKGNQNSPTVNLLKNSNVFIWENPNRMPPYWRFKSWGPTGLPIESSDQSEEAKFLSVSRTNFLGGRSFAMSSAIQNQLGSYEAGLFGYYRAYQTVTLDGSVNDMVLSLRIKSPGEDIGYVGRMYCKYKDDSGVDQFIYKDLTGYGEDFRRYQLKLPFQSKMSISSMFEIEVGIEVSENLLSGEGDVIYCTAFQLEKGLVATNWSRHELDMPSHIDRPQIGVSATAIHNSGLAVQLTRIDQDQILQSLYPTRAIMTNVKVRSEDDD